LRRPSALTRRSQQQLWVPLNGRLISFLEPWSRLGDRNADCQQVCLPAPVKAGEPKVKAFLIVTR
jgi:hypothetical protein